MKSIFIVDDDFDIIHLLSTWLQRSGYGVEGFSNAKELFIALNRRLPDIVFLDVCLGNEDGREVCKKIRKKYTNTIPIILFSAKYNSIKELQDGCADSYIKKNSNLRDIVSLLQEHINFENE